MEDSSIYTLHFKVPTVLRIHNNFFRFLGLFPLSVDANTRCWQLAKRLPPCLLLVLYTVLTLAVFTSNEEFLFSDDSFSYFNDALKVVAAYIAVFTIYSESFLRRESMSLFWKLYSDLLRLPPLEEEHTWLRKLRKHWRFLFMFYGIAFTEGFGQLLFALFQTKTRQMMLYWMMFVPFIYVVHFRNMQFILHMEIIRLELVKLQLDLGLLADYTRFARRVAPFEGFEEYIRRNLVEKQRIYQSIYEMFVNFQKSFGFSIVAVLLMMYVRILADSYFIYYTIYKGYNYNFLMITVLLEITAFLLTSKSCMGAVKHVTFQLHNIKGQVDSSVISMQIQNFSLQILHQKIRIDGVGIATMDGYMLARAIRSVTTYMIFFIQFMPQFENI